MTYYIMAKLRDGTYQLLGEKDDEDKAYYVAHKLSNNGFTDIFVLEVIQHITRYNSNSGNNG